VAQITPIFVSVREAAQMLSLDTWTVYKLLNEQRIKSQYEGRRRLVNVQSLHDYADSLPTTRPESA
jgi:excisionase family DNA binding protein